jgi:molecular chaperone DnaK
MTKVVGIDLGTTNTVVAAVRDGSARSLADQENQTLIPSVVSFHPNGSVLVGRSAKERRTVDPTNTIFSVKRLIGRSWDTEEVRRARSRLPFEMREGPGQAALVVARGETYTLPEISAFVLRKAKSVADAALGERVEQAVITVPANFNDLQRAATKVAGRVAGLEVSRILNEPTAAALAYGYGKSSSERLAVYDFGGGTFDVTLLDLSNNVFEVLATAGNTFLGGDDIDLAIAERMAEHFLRQHRYDPRSDPLAFHRFRLAAEEVKHRLSDTAEAKIEIGEVTHGPGGKALSLQFSMTRGELELLAAPIVDKTFDVCREALGVARIGVADLDQVLLVGGSTRMPLVQRRVEEFFRREAQSHVNPDEVVAIGAAIQATALAGIERRRGTVPPAPAAARRSAAPDPARATLPGTEARGDEAGALGRFRAPAVTQTPDTRPFAPREPMRTRPGIEPPEPAGARAGIVAPSPGQPGASTSTLMGLGRGRTRTGAGLGPEAEAAKAPPAVRTLESAKAEAAEARRLVELPPVPPPPPAPDELLAPPLRERSAAFHLSDEEIEELSSADEQPTGIQKPRLPLTGTLELPGAAAEDDAALPLPEVPDADDDAPTHVGAAPEGFAYQPPPAAFVPPAHLPRVPHAPHPPAFAPPAPPPPPFGFTAPAAVAPPAPFAPPLGLPPPAPFSPVSDAGSSPLRSAPESARPPSERAPSIPAPILVDVTPLTLSVETVGGYCDPIITRNTPVPCERAREFVTAADHQTQVRIRIGQGESTRFAANTLLGELELSGLRPGLRGSVQITVTFALDTNGMLNVSARDALTGRATSVEVRLVGLPDQRELASIMARQSLQRTL